jgi:hypothetical protein
MTLSSSDIAAIRAAEKALVPRAEYATGVLDQLTAEDFVPYQADCFRIVPREVPPFEVELTEVSVGETEGASRKQFSLVFRGGPTPPLPQQILRVEHDRLGALEIFLVPLGPDERGQCYQAVFT